MESKLHYGLRMERSARAWLQERFPELQLLTENYRWKGGELDLVFEELLPGRAPELVFVEVRARRSGSWTDGVESVTLPKQMRIARTIRHFLARYQGRARSARLDILAWDGQSWRHLRNVWLPSV